MNILYLFITHILMSKWGNYFKIIFTKAYLLFLLMTKTQIDFPYLMVNSIAKYIIIKTKKSTFKSLTLPYGMFLIKVFRYFGVSFESEESQSIPKSHIYDSLSPQCIGYHQDGTNN